jgi:CheY-like chemotaxis protein
MKMVASLGYDADVVANGLEVLDALKHRTYDMILMDCEMPELDGYATTAAIRQLSDSSLRQLPIIAITAHALDGERTRCADAGMDDYLTKPLRRAELARVLSAWSDQEQRPESRRTARPLSARRSRLVG